MTATDDMKKALGEFAEDFTVELEGNYITVHAKKWLPPEAFAEVKKRLQPFNAEWIKNGKLSHFRIVFNKAVVGSYQHLLNKLDEDLRMLGLVAEDLHELVKQLKEK